MSPSYALFKELRPKVVLGIAAHPDDLDFRVGGSMAKFAAMGADVHYLILTDGDKGSGLKEVQGKVLAGIRKKEQRAALRIIGGKTVTFLGYPDGELELTISLKKDIVRHIRKIKPDTVVTFDPTLYYFAPHNFINHSDHRVAGAATLA